MVLGAFPACAITLTQVGNGDRCGSGRRAPHRHLRSGAPSGFGGSAALAAAEPFTASPATRSDVRFLTLTPRRSKILRGTAAARARGMSMNARSRAPQVVAGALLLLAIASAACSASTPGASAAPATGAPGADAGASGDDDDAAPSSDGGDAAPAPRPHAPLPQVTSQGGPILDAVHLVTITFAGDPNDAAVAAFGDSVVGSAWLTEVGADYGVHGAMHTHVTLSDAAPATVVTADTESRLSALRANGTLPADAEALYMIVYPPGTTMGDLAPGMDCASSHDLASGAWHMSVTSGAASYAYAVVPTCAKEPRATLQETMSHELIEAMTDPFPLTTPAFVVPDGTGWHSVGEVADLCESLSPYDDAASGMSLTHVWSNHAAAAGGWPCIPAPSVPYVNVAPSADAVLHAHPGDTVKVELTAFSSASATATPPWKVEVYPSDERATASIDRAQVHVGDAVTVSVHVASDATAAFGPITVSVYSATPVGYTFWPIAVEID